VGLWNWKWTGSDHPRGIFSEVQATDVSAQQIANAIPETNVHYSVQPAQPTPDAYFDAVIVAQALHWFDLDQFWVEVNRVLRKGGVCRLGLYFSAFLQK